MKVDLHLVLRLRMSWPILLLPMDVHGMGRIKFIFLIRNFRLKFVCLDWRFVQ